jgi:hypothetical protein
MATVYSVLFLSQKGLTGSLVYTVPPGYVGILRDADVYAGASLLDQSLFMEDSFTGGAITGWVQSEGNAFAGIWRGRQVMEAGRGFLFNVASGTWDVRASGYLLTAP